MTDKALPCPRCNPTWNVETLGYVPLYRESDHKPCCVVLKETARDLATGLEFPHYVCVSKGHSKGDSVVVTRCDRQKKWFSTVETRKHPADLEYSLLTMWRINELTQWCGARSGGKLVPPIKADLDKPAQNGSEKLVVPVDQICGMLDANADRAETRAREGRSLSQQLRDRMKASENGDGTH
jgi:hypothetical protein